MNNVDILLTGEKKLDSPLPDGQCLIDDYNNLLQLDILYKITPTTQLTKLKVSVDIQIIIFEFKKRKVARDISIYR